VDWAGTIAGVAIPLNEDESIDWTSFEAHLESFVGCGLAGVVVNADTGEGALLAPDEREAVLQFAVRQIGDRLPVAAGLLPAHTAAAAASARVAGDIGAAALQVFTPSVFMGAPLAWEPVAAYYEAIAAATDVPLIVYQAPAGLGVAFELEVLRRLAEIPRVQAIKESSWSRPRFAEAAAAFAGERHDVALLSGEDSFILESLVAGADGAMLAAAASDAGAYVTMWTLRGTVRAAELQAALDPYIERLFALPLRNFRARLKAVLAHDGAIATPTVRSPLQSIGDDEAARLNEALVAGRRRIEDVLSNASS
jgi:4-hydroxy-tetrahydrodipicolinate synthase